ncbi:GNAT family N-acetyltransferase [Bacillus sp. FJAT-47783]|uniref:GNAT family N-acetyltransferase n=1 Tax=Bacillus sp. FJAT-47783 TaxID=2922712 RepID=UPI001FAC9540|nr:GNAT family N-acetyltransferase [Bacillus sp. FJAT-47783]
MDILYEGRLQKNDKPFLIKPLSLDHLEQILSLQEMVIESLENKETLQPLSSEEYHYILKGNGLMIGAFVEGELIAFRALLVPPIDDEEHLGLDIGLSVKELTRVIYQEISNVHPAYRGNRLQKTLAGIIMQQLQQTKCEYNYVCCTVAPFNIPSLKDKFAQGMEIAALKEKYGDRMRYIFVKELLKNEKIDWTDVATLRMDDFTGQQTLLSDGFRGFEMENRDGEYWVRYGKKVK